MRIATWNVNSLRARLEKVGWWLERARPDVLLMQETKLADGDAPHDDVARWGYTLAHHGEGRWNGVAIASRVGLDGVVANFGAPRGPAATREADDQQPLAEARMIAATCGPVRVVSIYAPNGRSVGSPFFVAKLAWFARLQRWLERESVTPRIVGEFDDSALMKAFGQNGQGIFVGSTALEREVRDQYGVRVLGRTDAVREEFFAISVERRLSHPCVIAITDRARGDLFTQPAA